MISRRVKLQLFVFVAITLLGISYVGAKYAQLDRLVVDKTYQVKAEFADSGGIFTGAEVTYRGVGIGKVSDLELTSDGVDVVLEIEKDSADVPSDVRAVVANKSAVGEQYVDLQPNSDGGPYLHNDSQIPVEETEIPISTTKLLVDVNKLVNSVDKQNLRTVVDELGTAFNGTGRDLARIIDTSNAFIEAADDNFDVTAALIRDSSTVLQTQVEAEDDISEFSKNLALLSDTLVDSDQDLRNLIDNGSETSKHLRQVIAENSEELGVLLNNVRTTNDILVANLDGTRALFILYPYVVEGGFTVAAKNDTGNYEANFGLVLEAQGLGDREPEVCENHGYRDKRLPENREEKPFETDIECSLPPSQAVPRASKNAQYQRNAPVVGVYDDKTKTVTPPEVRPSDVAVPDARKFGKDSWKWLLLGPTATK